MKYLGRFTIVMLLLSLPRFAGATIVDLTTLNSSGTINGAIFKQVCPTAAAGTGVYDTFLRIQNKPVEHGYNTDGAVEFDTTAAHTHSLRLSAIPTVTIGSTTYREFGLDINQNTNFLSLDDLKIFVFSQPNLTGFETDFGTPIYDMDQYSDNSVKINYNLNAGSGRADIVVLVDSSLFGTDANKYVYLYSKLGVTSSANDGFEEWGVGVGSPIIPEPATIAILALGSLAFHRNKK